MGDEIRDPMLDVDEEEMEEDLDTGLEEELGEEGFGEDTDEDVA